MDKQTIKQVSDETYFATQKFTKIKKMDIEFLKEKASLNKRKRVRLCAHDNVDEPIHEMLLVHAKGNYVPPHKHIGQTESFHIIDGFANVIIFNERGEITQVVELGSYSSGKVFYYRLSHSLYHTMLIISDFIVFHETKNGPFDPSKTILAPWAPLESDEEAGRMFMERLSEEKDIINN